MEVFSDSPNPKPKVCNLFVKLLDGKTLNLKFDSPNLPVHLIKHRLCEITRIHPQHQRLLTGLRNLTDGDSVVSIGDRMFPTVHMLLRLVGGKGGFGSLLRGAATKAGQKKTNNFDACRDMSGRRLRHVNAEKKLEEWKAGEEERRLEKMAEEFLKKQAKKGKKGAGDGEAQKYVAKYREISERCTADVAESVKEALMAAGNGKRKALKTEMGKAEAKKMKIWMGKRKLGEIDSDNEEEDSSEDEEGSDKSTVLNNGNQSDSSKETERSSESVIAEKEDVEISGRRSSDGESEGRKPIWEGNDKSDDSPCKDFNAEPVIEDERIPNQTALPSFETDDSGSSVRETLDQGNDGLLAGASDIGISQIAPSPRANLQGTVTSELDVESPSGEKAGTLEEKPLDLKLVNSASELEALGMDRLKSELQAHRLKCGGTLQERASRLFLLKTTPLEKLPKKLLAKK